MKQKSSQMRFAPWPVVQAALALALSGLLLARPQAAAQGFAAGLKLCGGSLLPALFPLFVVCGLLGPLAPALGWPLRPLVRLCGIRSPRAPAVLVLGWCGGYAVCAQQIAGWCCMACSWQPTLLPQPAWCRFCQSRNCQLGRGAVNKRA